MAKTVLHYASDSEADIYKASCRSKLIIGRMCELIDERLCTLPLWFENCLSSARVGNMKTITYDFYTYASDGNSFVSLEQLGIHNRGLVAGREDMMIKDGKVIVSGKQVIPFAELCLNGEANSMHVSWLYRGHKMYCIMYSADDKCVILLEYDDIKKQSAIIDKIALKCEPNDRVDHYYRCDIVPLNDGNGIVLCGASNSLWHLYMYTYTDMKRIGIESHEH
ncbi:MAG: hypothetical protein U0796_00260 [Gemmatales bacterium]